jgi:hypothetical protein
MLWMLPDRLVMGYWRGNTSEAALRRLQQHSPACKARISTEILSDVVYIPFAWYLSTNTHLASASVSTAD